MHFTAPCISSLGIYGVSWWSNFLSSTVCFFTLLPCAKNTHLLSTVMHGRDTKQGLGLALRLRGVFGSISGRKMDSEVLTGRVCSSLGLPELGLHERVCVYLWEIPILLPAHPGESDALLPVLLSCNSANLSEWLGIFFLTCALYYKPPLQCPQQLQGAAGLRSGQGARFCTLWDVTPPGVSTGCRWSHGSILCFPAAQTCQSCQNPCMGAFRELGSEAFGSCNYTNKGLLTTTAFPCFTVWCLGSWSLSAVTWVWV